MASAAGKTSSGSSGSKTSGSSGSTSGKSSGSVSYDKNQDYQALIDQAAAKGDYRAAAQYEQQRNAKIAGTNSQYTQTHKYAGWLDNTDYGTIGKNQMANGASAEDVLDTYNKRYNKSAGTVGLQQYANDELQQQMWDYIMAHTGDPDAAAPSFDYNDYLEGNPRPSYESKYDPQMEALLNQILNREDFSYNAETDPLYQQYAAMYQREGDRSMRDTMAEAAAQAGGMNSYAVTAAQQAGDYYSSQLNDRIPELYQLAYQMYLQDKESQVEDLGLLQSMDNTQYNRYRDTMSDWYNDRDFAYGAYRDDMGDYQWNKSFNYNQAINDRNFNYNAGRDAISDNRYADEWNYNVNRDTVEDKRYESETAYNRAMNMLQSGIMPDAATLASAGISGTEASAYIAAAQAAARSSGGGSYSGNNNSDSVEDSIMDTLYGMDDETDVTAYLLASDLPQWKVNEYLVLWQQNREKKNPNGYEPMADLNAESNGSGTAAYDTLKYSGLSERGKQIADLIDSDLTAEKDTDRILGMIEQLPDENEQNYLLRMMGY